MKVGVVDYNAGNLRSVETALRHIGVEFAASADPAAFASVDRLIFPGVGDAGAAMDVLNRTGLAEAIRSFYRSGKPLLGICLGSQIVLDGSEETSTPCLGIVAGRARLFPFAAGAATAAGDADAAGNGHESNATDNEGARLKVPHIGWNTVRPLKEDPLFDGIPDGASFYFDHSYYTEPVPGRELCQTDYGIDFVSGLRQDNLWAVQFHPEKSGETGLEMLRNFLRAKV